MFRHLLFYSIGFIIVCSSLNCGESQGNGTESKPTSTEEKVTVNGFKYVHHIQNEGPKPQIGQYAYFNLETYGIAESPPPRFMDATQSYIKVIDPKTRTGYREKNPLVDILPLLSIGDSVSIFHSTDSIINLPISYGGINFLEYRVTLTNIKDPKDHSESQIEKFNKRKERILEAQANLNELTAFCLNVLKDYKAGNLDNLVEKPSGIKYVIHKKGYGQDLRTGNIINILNYGILMDGTIFENSFETGAMQSIQIGKRKGLPGMEEAIKYLKKGSKASIFIPYNLAYGVAGNPPTIPPKSDVMFYLELME